MGKNLKYIILFVLVLGTNVTELMGQNYYDDDLYYSPKAEKEGKQVVSQKVSKTTTTTNKSTYQSVRDIDEYNRQGDYITETEEIEDEGTIIENYSAKERIIRFHRVGNIYVETEPYTTNVYVLDSYDYDRFVLGTTLFTLSLFTGHWGFYSYTYDPFWHFEWHVGGYPYRHWGFYHPIRYHSYWYRPSYWRTPHHYVRPLYYSNRYRRLIYSGAGRNTNRRPNTSTHISPSYKKNSGRPSSGNVGRPSSGYSQNKVSSGRPSNGNVGRPSSSYNQNKISSGRPNSGYSGRGSSGSSHSSGNWGRGSSGGGHSQGGSSVGRGGRR